MHEQEIAFRIDSLPVLIGTGMLILWAAGERLLRIFGLLQPKSPERERLSYYWHMLSFYGAVLFSLVDATVLHQTTISTTGSGLCYAGVPLLLAGFAVRVVSRLTLGKHFSGHVQTAEGHRLVTTGIYRVVRHPAYVGYLCLLLGFPICFGSMGGLSCALVSGVPGLLYRVRIEEAALTKWFGEDYRRYHATTPRFIPRLW